jgi:peptide/nickel transport system substrate-binding protein
MEEANYWTRLNRRRLSRRAVLSAGATAALGVGAAAVVGCGGNGNNSSSSGPNGTCAPQDYGTPAGGGSITQGRLLNVLGIDPHIDLTGLDIDMRLYSYLYSWKPFEEGPIFNNFAESVEIPNPDQTEFIFTLRRGVKIQSQSDNPAAGEELTSNDVKESWVRRGTALTAPDKRFPLRISGANGIGPEHENGLRSEIRTPDPYTFTFKMKSPFVPAFREMSNPTWAIVPAKVIERYGSSFQFGGLGQKAWGSGPYMISEFRGTERIILKRHPEYFLSPRPWLEEIRYIIITEPQSLLAAFDSKQHDVNGALMNRAQAEERAKNCDLVVKKAPTRFYPVIHFKTHQTLPYSDIRVREAFDLAIDREEIISLIWDGEGFYNGPVQWLMARFALPQDELRGAQPYDPEKAKQLLSAAGYGDGLEAKMKIPRVPGAPFIADLSALLKDQFSKVGINLLLDEVELGTFIANVILPGNFELAFFPNLPYDEPDRPLSFYHTRGVTGVGNWNNYTNREIDQLIDSQSVDFNEETRIKTILDVQKMMLAEHGPQITMPSGNFYAARWNYVHFPYEFGVDPGEGALEGPTAPGPEGTEQLLAGALGPEASDIYTREGAA